MEHKKARQSEAQLGSTSEEVFEAALDVLARLCQTGKCQLFLPREYAVRLVGDMDDVARGIADKQGLKSFERNDAERVWLDIQVIISVFLWAGTAEKAVNVLKKNVFEEEFKKAKHADEAALLQKALQQRVDRVKTKLNLIPLVERSKRIATAIGPLLEDVDVELIQQRHLEGNSKQLTSPFLRLRLRYTEGGKTSFPFIAPPWAGGFVTQQMNSFEFECDETEIDLMIRRLLSAKDILAKAITTQAQRTAS